MIFASELPQPSGLWCFLFYEEESVGVLMGDS